MIYTTHGAMTPEDLAEVRRDLDLDLCGCCETGGALQGDPDSPDDCEACGHGGDSHVE